MRKSIIACLLFGSVLFVGCSTALEDEIKPDLNTSIENSEEINYAQNFHLLPDEVLVNFPGLYPEGIAFDPWKGKFYISSVRKGVISSVDFDGNIETLTGEGDLISTAGVKFQPFQKRIIACNGDVGVSEFSSPSTIGTLAEVGVLKAHKNYQLDFFDLSGLSGGPQFINDLTYDWFGNIYITDSFSPVIYKVDRRGNEGILTENEAFLGNPGGFGLNGIAWNIGGFLIVSNYDQGKLLKVSLRNPSDVQEIAIDADIASPDGLLFLDRNTLLMVGNALSPAVTGPTGVYKLKTRDNWKSAQVVDFMPVPDNFPTTLTRVYNQVYVLYGEIDKLLTGAPEVQSYTIKKVKF
ncbi:hypothetical protein E1176_10900 [Fulvivirga sp. RKSG066]|uniref:hypothetical protein n=1 Tax=Fulvivirga aurantia TaxID=2529383 RepID=UPI0012BCC841|nr:hypothetical protein [Fulvivirga aurantia]MTI21527.1 hypothetical protein [Fulvivirga aurantia]